MRKKFTLISALFLLFGTAGYAQTATGKSNTGGTTGNKGEKFGVKWKANPFDEHVFIENKGQFDGKIKSGEKVLYGVQLGCVDIYFTKDEIVYRYDKYYFKAPANGKGDKDDPKNFRHDTYILNAEWQNSNNAVSVETKDEQKRYYTYPDGLNKGIKANIYKQIVYKNLYPGVDAIYQFIDGQNGLKYSLIVHPGADLSKIKISYSGAKNISKNSEGDIVISSGIDLLTEHAPVTSYLGESGSIAFSNVLNGNTESFKTNENYDKSKTLVIDPWQTDPLFTPWDKAYDLEWDYKGNVYAYGGYAASTLMLTKMSSTGAIIWTYNCVTIPGSYYGDIAVDKVTGTTYIEEGFGGKALKVNTLGVLLATLPENPDINEFWRADYDACNGDIVIAGGGTSGDDQAGVLDTNMTTVNPVNIMGVGTNCHDNSLLTIDPNGNECYIASARSLSVDPNHANNVIMKLPLPSLSPTIYEVPDFNHFIEVSSITYSGKDAFNESYANGMNGAAASPDWLYLYNGDTVRRYNKATGAYISGIAISPNTPFEYGGLAVDACDNLFVGVKDSIYVYDSTYAIQAKISLSDTIYDLQLGQGTALYASGKGYVTQLINPHPPQIISSASGTPTSCAACNGTATVNVNCGISPYSFQWSDGSTNETDTGLCAGVYTVTVTDASCPPHTDTATVSVTGENGYSATVTDTNPNCGLRKGNAAVHPTGGHPPYTYSWSNGSTNQQDTGLVAGVYTCIITDNSGCKYAINITLINPTSPTVTVVPSLDSVCAGSSLSLLASGAKTYSWTPPLGLSCDNCPNPTATPTATTTYTITGTDSIGCTDVTTAKIKIIPGPLPVITGPDSACAGSVISLNVTGGSDYQWVPSGSTTTSILVTAVTTQTISVFASNGACHKDTSFVLTVVPAPTASIAASKDSVCSGDSVTLEGSSGLKYRWEPGNQTTSVIHVSPFSTTTYTLYCTSLSCEDSITKTIYMIPAITASIRSTVDSICPSENATITATGSGGTVTYQWSPGGATTSSITVSPDSTTTYSVNVVGPCNTVQKTYEIVYVPLPAPVITGTDWKCKGVRDTLSVSNPNGPATYVWSNGKTSTSIYTGSIDADSSVTVTAYNKLGCPHDTTFNILLRLPDNISITPPSPFCAGQPVTITANATGNPGPNSYSWSPGGGTTSSITVSPDSATAYVVTVSNGCKSSKSTLLTPNYPNLNACCSQTISLLNDTLTPLTVTFVAGGNSIKYQWAPPVNCLNPPLCDSVQPEPTPSVTTTYTVTGTDSLGCTVNQYVTITVDIPCFNLTIPNVFTPTNGGTLGLDKVFYIKTDNIDAWSLTIFDRWGKEMFSTTDQYKYWTGNTESGGQAPAGVYYYIISGTCQNTSYKKDGFVQLIR